VRPEERRRDLQPVDRAVPAMFRISEGTLISFVDTSCRGMRAVAKK